MPIVGLCREKRSLDGEDMMKLHCTAVMSCGIPWPAQASITLEEGHRSPILIFCEYLW